MVDQDVSINVCANFRDSRLKPSEASFLAFSRTSITSDRKYIVTSSGVVVDPTSVKVHVKLFGDDSEGIDDHLESSFGLSRGVSRG